MHRLLDFPLQEGEGSVLVQVEDTAFGEPTRGLSGNAIVERSHRAFEQALAGIRPAAQAVIDAMRGLADFPDEVGVEFGVQLSAEAGAFIASGSTTANFKVSLTWRRADASALAKAEG